MTDKEELHHNVVINPNIQLSDRFTAAEFIDLFGENMPMDAVNIVMDKNRTLEEKRTALRKSASAWHHKKDKDAEGET